MKARTPLILSFLLVGLTVSNCATSVNLPSVAEVEPNSNNDAIVAQSAPVLWSNQFDSNNWQDEWNVRKKRSWGWDNVQIIADPTQKFSRILRVHYPAGSASPSVSRKQKVAIGGGQFLADLGLPPRDSLTLSYYVRFSENFDFVKGGKLPGLFGGEEISGGNVPDGTNGFSTRYMWRKNGDGEVYSYLPTSDEYGTSIGRGAWQFKPGVWHHLVQEVKLNQPGKEDGRIRVWVDGKQVLDRDGLLFRTTDQLKIEGIFFSTFFGGGDPSWATPKDVYADFADFSVY